MKAVFEDDDKVNEGYLIVFVTDNNEVEHEITFEKSSWDIVYHGQDGYPDDPAKRTPEGNEHVEQARRFARYHVYTERGYPTLPPYENPDILGVFLLILSEMSEERVEELFGDLRVQLLSRHAPEVDPVMPEPADPDSHHITYRQHVYLAEDHETIIERFRRRIGRALEGAAPDLDGAEVLARAVERTPDGMDAAGPADRAGRALGRVFGVRPGRDGPGPDVAGRLDSDIEFDPDFEDVATVEAVSDLQAVYSGVTTGNRQRIVGDDADDRQPDVRLELWPLGRSVVEEFKRLLQVHVACQLRDCYLGMGVDPPEPYRLLGPGLWEYTRKYVNADEFEMYERYHVMDEDIDGFRSMAE